MSTLSKNVRTWTRLGLAYAVVGTYEAKEIVSEAIEGAKEGYAQGREMVKERRSKLQ